jgi:hypothetical protein
MKNILIVLHHPNSGIDWHRFILPYQHLQQKNKSFFTLDTIYSYHLNIDNDQFWNKYDTVIVNSVFTNEDKYYIDKIKAKGIRVIIDIDDYWQIDKKHPSYENYTQKNEAETRLYNIKQADAVTVSTPLLFDACIEHNPNTYLLPNCLFPNLHQFKVLPKPEQYRVGWLGGSSHLPNIELIRDLIKPYNDYQFVLAGYSNEVSQNITLPSGRQVYESWDAKGKGAFAQMENIITHDLKSISDLKYRNYLKQYTQKGEEQFLNNPQYIRLWAQKLNAYPKLYNVLHTVLYPLQPTEFNKYKSNLRLIEAFHFDCQVVASTTVQIHEEFKPYIHFVNPYQNWRNKIKEAKENPIDLTGAKEIIKLKYSPEKYEPIRLSII